MTLPGSGIGELYVSEPGPLHPWRPPEPATDLIAAPLFPSPFFRGHCVVMSFAHLKEKPSYDFASTLALKAYEVARPIRDPREETDTAWGHNVHRLLDANDGGAYAEHPEDVATWLALTGLRQVERLAWAPAEAWWNPGGAPSLEKFAREHPTGRWFIGINGHAVALVEGKLFGVNWTPYLNFPLRVAVRVEEAAQ